MTSSILFQRAARLLLLFSPLLAFGAPGDLDPTFGTGGVTDSVAPVYASDLAIQTDGKVVVVGPGTNGGWTIARYKHNGKLDNTFSDDGWTTISPSAEGSVESCVVAIQPDGKILIGGSAVSNTPARRGDFAVARLNPDGTLDNTFSGDGVAVTRAERDESGHVSALVIQPDGKIVAVGQIPSFRGLQVVRYMPDGSLDTTFGSNGLAMPGYGPYTACNAATIQPDGKILLACGVQIQSQFGIGRLLANGNEDKSFSDDGWVICDFVPGMELPEAISLLPDGRITISGRAGSMVGYQYYVSNEDYAVMRVMPNGTFDTSFSGDGKNLIPVESIPGMAQAGDTVGPWHVLRPDGKILLGGWYPRGDGASSVWCFARLDAAGELDTTFSGDGFAPASSDSPFRSVRRLVAQPDGKVLTILEGQVARFIVDVDFDGDGADDSTEAANGTNPNDRDSDHDGLEDGPELAVYHSNPMDSDSDNDGLFDGAEVNLYHTDPLLFDSDGDGLGDYAEVATYGTDPSRADSDGDGLTDSAELQIYLTNPKVADSDGDGLSDGVEITTYGTNPEVADTDGDGFLDGYEVHTGKSPLSSSDKPALVAEARTAIEFSFPSSLGKTYRIEGSLDLSVWTTVETGIVGNGGEIQRFYSTRNLPKRYFRVEESPQ